MFCVSQDDQLCWKLMQQFSDKFSESSKKVYNIIKVYQALFESLIKNTIYCFLNNNSKTLCLHKIYHYFWVSQTIGYIINNITFQESVDDF